MASSPLWQPSDSQFQQSALFRFRQLLNLKYNLSLASYSDVHAWSIENLADFWSTIWDTTGIVGIKGAHVVHQEASPASNPGWFKDSKLNWAENMLRCRASDKTALIQVTEPIPDIASSPQNISYADLYHRVADCVSALLGLGLKPGDRVASYTSNSIENVIACLATAAIGCIWVSAAADFGSDGVLERFEQVKPRVIFSVDEVIYNGKAHPHLSKLSSLIAKLTCPLAKVIVVTRKPTKLKWDHDWVDWTSFLRSGASSKLGRSDAGEIEWVRMSFDWPLWILFSSGTTGKPKAIVHRAGGMLLQSRKEFAICADLKQEDVFFYYTTTGWMMWNFLVSGLASGCTLVLYDGSPLRDPSFLWRMVDDLAITIFGTSAKYIDQLSKVYTPRENHSLATLRHIYSTGSPLAPRLFDFVYKHVREDILLGSITGGTDICSLFAGMCSALPVFSGEIQCRLLGMAVETYSSSGKPSRPGEAGELVCTRPFPCMPLGFWPLPGYDEDAAVEAAAKRFKGSYFTEYPNVWYHGDHVLITDSRYGNGGGLVMLGRSDGVLNPGGVRFGSSELYDVVESCFKSSVNSNAADVIVDCIAVGQSLNGGTDERVILFVKMTEEGTCTEELRQRIKMAIRVRRSARHVPERIIQVQDIPYTLNGKRVEVPIKKLINGTPVSSVNPATLRNPECLDEFVLLGQSLREEVGGSRS